MYNYHANLKSHFKAYPFTIVPRNDRFCVQIIFANGKKFSLRPDNVGPYLKYLKQEVNRETTISC